MSFRRLVLALIIIAIFTMAMRIAIDSDTWWHLRAGSWIMENKDILRTDPFSLTRFNEPWIYPGWLAQVTMFITYENFGFAGLNILTALMVLVAFFFVLRSLDTPPLLNAFIVLFAAVTSAVYWSARPHILSFALSGINIWALEKARKGKLGVLWILPFLMALWVNLHGGFFIGFLLMFAYLAGGVIQYGLLRWQKIEGSKVNLDELKSFILRLAIVLGLCLLAVCLNPHGPVMILYPFETLSIGVLREHIQEWQSPNFHDNSVLPFLFLFLTVLVVLALSPKRPSATELILVVGFGILAFFAARNIALFALVVVPVVARHAFLIYQDLPAKPPASKPLPPRLTNVLNLILLFMVLVASAVKISTPLSLEANIAAIEESMPVKAARFIEKSQPAGPLFNSYNWGGYVLWSLHPEYLSFVDGRTDLFDDEILAEYLVAWKAEDGWHDTFERWDIRLALLEPYSPLVDSLIHNGWSTLYEDDLAVVLGQ